VLGYSGLSEQTLVEKSLVVMRGLRDRFKGTVPLGILQENEGLVIEEVPGTYPFRFVLEPGKRFHLHTAASGKAMVAFLPGEKNGKVYQIELKKFNERTIMDKETYRKVLEEVRRLGYAVARAEEIEGMHCIGAPIFNRYGYPVAEIWITGPSIRITEKDFPIIGEEVKKHAAYISKSLGFRGTSNNINNYS